MIDLDFNLYCGMCSSELPIDVHEGGKIYTVCDTCRSDEYDRGHTKGHEDGYSIGHIDGYYEGHYEGYSEGLSHCDESR